MDNVCSAACTVLHVKNGAEGVALLEQLTGLPNSLLLNSDLSIRCSCSLCKASLAFVAYKVCRQTVQSDMYGAGRLS